jgi:hypothetical protein
VDSLSSPNNSSELSSIADAIRARKSVIITRNEQLRDLNL